MGWFGFAVGDYGVCRSCMGCSDYGSAEKYLLVGMYGFKRDEWLFLSVQERVRGYFAGEVCDFDDVEVDFGDKEDFGRRVLERLQAVKAGETVSYSELARLAGSDGAARAVGNILAGNPVPLFVPCHRVIRSDGSVGGFMGNREGGREFKKRMLEMETDFVKGVTK
jgi:O-6-methylguanine DNA methyltransferase